LFQHRQLAVEYHPLDRRRAAVEHQSPCHLLGMS
jgi:hypothetical protein